MTGPEAPLVRRSRSGRAHRLAGLVSGVVLTLAGCTSPAPEPPEVVVDLLQQDWANVPGVSVAGAGLRVTPTAWTVLGPGGDGRQPNPPLNLAGVHLVTDGDVVLEARFENSTADASWAVYDSPPVVADEFRIEPPGVRLTLDGDDLRITVVDDSRQEDVTNPRPLHDEHVTVADPEAVLSLRRTGNTLVVASDGDTLSSVPVGGVFRSGDLWLGLSSDRGSFEVGSLTAAGASLRVTGPAVAQAEPTATGLQAAATRVRPGFRVGAAVALGPLASDADYAGRVVGEFGALTPENAMKPQYLSPLRGVYTFGEADALLAAAGRAGIAVHGHTIAFGEALPAWMEELPTGTAGERRASADALLDYVSTVVTHFRGRLASLDVVNEPFDLDQGTSLQENVWYRTFGPDYPVVVSRAVHDADPDVLQFVNENGADVPGERQDALLDLVRRTNAMGGHLDGVGLQAHVYDLDTDAITADDLGATLEVFGNAGLQVRISENDVTDARGPQAQAEQYAEVVTTCLRSPVCVSYTTWGVDDRYDWWVDDGGLHQGHDLLFDDGRPTAAYEAVSAALRAPAPRASTP